MMNRQDNYKVICESVVLNEDRYTRTRGSWLAIGLMGLFMPIALTGIASLAALGVGVYAVYKALKGRLYHIKKDIAGLTKKIERNKKAGTTNTYPYKKYVIQLKYANIAFKLHSDFVTKFLNAKDKNLRKKIKEDYKEACAVMDLKYKAELSKIKGGTTLQRTGNL